MASAFTLASWNVEHFKNPDARLDRVIEFLKKQNPDVFALYEVARKGCVRRINQSLIQLQRKAGCHGPDFALASHRRFGCQRQPHDMRFP